MLLNSFNVWTSYEIQYRIQAEEDFLFFFK